MLRDLLGTTAFVGVMASLLGNVHAAGDTGLKPPSKTANKLAITISGKTSFNAITGSQSQKGVYVYKTAELDTVPTYYLSNNQANMFTVDGSRVGFEVLGKTDSNIEYGLHIALTGNTGTSFSVRENYISLRGYPGTVLLGDTTGVDDAMAFGGGDTQVGTGGFDGNFGRLVASTYGVSTNLDLGHYGDTGDATKITYMTPRLEGFQLGVSYTPDGKHDGEDPLETSSNFHGALPNPFHRNAVGAGVNYVQELQDKFKVSLSLTTLSGKIRPERSYPGVNQSLARNSAFSWAVGGVVEYDKCLEVGAEYIDNGKSAQFSVNRPGVDPGIGGLPTVDYVASRAQAAKLWNVGLGYTFGPTGATKVSVGYLSSQRQTGFSNYKATAGIVTGGIEQKLAEGFVVYGEYANYDLKNPGAPYEARLRAQSFKDDAGAVVAAVVRNQRANAIILGTKIQF